MEKVWRPKADLTRRLAELFSDGEPHTQDEVIAKLSPYILDGRAYRYVEERRIKTLQKKAESGGEVLRPDFSRVKNESTADVVRLGKRGLVSSALFDTVRNGFTRRWEEGETKWYQLVDNVRIVTEREPTKREIEKAKRAAEKGKQEAERKMREEVERLVAQKKLAEIEAEIESAPREEAIAEQQDLPALSVPEQDVLLHGFDEAKDDTEPFNPALSGDSVWKIRARLAEDKLVKLEKLLVRMIDIIREQ